MSTKTKSQSQATSQKKVTCKICGEKFDNTGYLLQHYQQEHPKKSDDKQTKDSNLKDSQTKSNKTKEEVNDEATKEMRSGKEEASQAEAWEVGDNTGDDLPVISTKAGQELKPAEYNRTLPADIMPEELKWLKPGHTVGLRVTGRLNDDGSVTVGEDVAYL